MITLTGVSGAESFVYDIEGHMLEWKTKRCKQIIDSRPTRSLDTDTDSVLKTLIILKCLFVCLFVIRLFLNRTVTLS